MPRILLLFIALSLSGSVLGQNSLDKLLRTLNEESVPYISVDTLRMLQENDDIIICDSRELEEFEVSSIDGAIYVGYNEFKDDQIASLNADRNTPIVIYCSLGVRSEDIAERFQKAGYTNVKNLYGGIFEWKNKGYPVVDSTGTETERVHAFSKAWGKWLKNGKRVYD